MGMTRVGLHIQRLSLAISRDCIIALRCEGAAWAWALAGLGCRDLDACCLCRTPAAFHWDRMGWGW